MTFNRYRHSKIKREYWRARGEVDEIQLRIKMCIERHHGRIDNDQYLQLKRKEWAGMQYVAGIERVTNTLDISLAFDNAPKIKCPAPNEYVPA